MDLLLILAPEQFRCRSKFDRKVSKLVSEMGDFDIVCNGDPHGYIADLFAADFRARSISCFENWADAPEPTKAIIFDDGEEFSVEREALKTKGVPTRVVQVPITRVVNVKRHPEYQKQGKSTAKYEYIGRGSKWGNPYSMYEAGESREDVIGKFKYDFEHDLSMKFKASEVHELAGKRLGCYCKPESCHGDVFADFLNSYDDYK